MGGAPPPNLELSSVCLGGHPLVVIPPFASCRGEPHCCPYGRPGAFSSLPDCTAPGQSCGPQWRGEVGSHSLPNAGREPRSLFPQAEAGPRLPPSPSKGSLVPEVRVWTNRSRGWWSELLGVTEATVRARPRCARGLLVPLPTTPFGTTTVACGCSGSFGKSRGQTGCPGPETGKAAADRLECGLLQRPSLTQICARDPQHPPPPTLLAPCSRFCSLLGFGLLTRRDGVFLGSPQHLRQCLAHTWVINKE